MKTNYFAVRLTALLITITATFLFSAAPVRGQTVYVTADNGSGTNPFGTLNLATGVFSEIAATNELFLGLTTGSGSTIVGADSNTGHLFTISPTGVTTQLGSSTAPNVWLGLAYSGGTNNFFPDNNVSGGPGTLYSISGNGNTATSIGVMTNPPKSTPSGALAYSFSGNLYFDYDKVDNYRHHRGPLHG